MTHKTKAKIFKTNLIIILIGVPLLFWYYFIDGVYINQPIVHADYIDINNFQIEKDTYNVGETPVMLTAFCKNRQSSGIIEWTLIDGQKVSYGPSEPREIPEGCYPNNASGYVRSPIERIPTYIENTCDAYFVGVVTRTISGGRKVKEYYKTEKFCIVNNAQE